jgi:hypothetical protein
MIDTFLVIFTDSAKPDMLEKCLLSQGFQHDIVAGDSFALTGPYCQALIEHLWQVQDHARCEPAPRTPVLAKPSGRRWTAEQFQAILLNRKERRLLHSPTFVKRYG